MSYKEDNTVTPVDIDDDYTSSTDGWSTPGTGSINNSNQKLNISITNKWNKSSKYLSIAPNVPLHIEFDFENGTMDKPVFFVKERINGVWEPNGNRDYIWDIQDGHHVMDITLTGDYIRIYFEKGGSSDNGTSTICYVDNFKLTQIGLQIQEENNYYPFGLRHKGYNNIVNGTNHKYGFGGKEEQDELGLGWIDITARNYDPALGRWMNLDPLAEQMRRHSPYNYAFNNPIFFIDYDGMMPFGAGDPPGWMKRLSNWTSKNIGQPITKAAKSLVEKVESVVKKRTERETIGSGVIQKGNGTVDDEYASKASHPEDNMIMDKDALDAVANVAGNKKASKGNGMTNGKDLSKKNWANSFADGVDEAGNGLKPMTSGVDAVESTSSSSKGSLSSANVEVVQYKSTPSIKGRIPYGTSSYKVDNMKIGKADSVKIMSAQKKYNQWHSILVDSVVLKVINN